MTLEEQIKFRAKFEEYGITLATRDLFDTIDDYAKSKVTESKTEVKEKMASELGTMMDKLLSLLLLENKDYKILLNVVIKDLAKFVDDNDLGNFK